MAYWIGVVHEGHTRKAEAEGFVAFSHGKRAGVEKLMPGDRIAYYAPRTGMDGAPVQSFLAIATVTGDATYERDYEGDLTAWVRDATFETGLQPAAVKPLLEDLSFVKNPKNWGMAFRRGIFQIDETDFARIERAMQP